MRGLSWVDQCLWNPDRSGVIPQANDLALEVFDADPCADQAIEHVYWLERRQCCCLGRLGDEVRDAVDLFIEASFDGSELIEQAFNPIAARQLLGFPIFA